MSVRLDAVDRVASVCLAVALCVSMSGCKKKGESTTPYEDMSSVSKSEDDSGDPIAELAALEGRMRTFGLPVATDKRGTAEGEDGVSTAVSGGAGADTEQPAEEEAPMPAPTASGDATEQPPSRDETANYCGDLCSLSESICTLEVRICSLAEAHANDATYTDACERAIEDCEVAGEACDSCG